MKLVDIIKSAGQPVSEREPDHANDSELGYRYACWDLDKAGVSVREDVDRWEISITIDHPTARPDIWRDIVAMINARFGEEIP